MCKTMIVTIHLIGVTPETEILASKMYRTFWIAKSSELASFILASWVSFHYNIHKNSANIPQKSEYGKKLMMLYTFSYLGYYNNQSVMFVNVFTLS